MVKVTKADLQDLAEKLGHDAAKVEKMTKPKLVALIGQERIDLEFKYTSDPTDAADFAGMLVDGIRYEKTWELSKKGKSNAQLYVAVFVSGDNNVLVVRRSASGPGLGKGGAKWQTEMVKM
jgi:hypothetical protein